MKPVKILAFAGSARKDSFNKKLIQIAAQGARSAGAEVTVIDLKDYPMPIFDQDLESVEGLPKNAQTLRKIFLSHQGFLIASPEYNSAVTPLLKNTIDWISRAYENDPSLACFDNKTAALMSASPGALGGLRGLVHLRLILSNMKVLVLPDQLSVPRAHEAFDTQGVLKDAKLKAQAEALGRSLTKMLSAL